MNNIYFFNNSNLTCLSHQVCSFYNGRYYQILVSVPRINVQIPKHPQQTPHKASIEQLESRIQSSPELSQIPALRDRKTLESLQELSHLTQSSPEGLRFDYKDLVSLVVGIKPVVLVEEFQDESFIKWAKKFPHLKIIEKEGHNKFVLNPNPLPDFDPRKYLHLGHADLEEVCYDIMEKYALDIDDITNNQYLCIFLGFGPTWQDYAKHCGVPCPNDNPKSVPPPFTEAYYAELGEVLKPHEDRDNQILAGKEYVNNFSDEKHEMRRIGFIIGDVALQTPYIEKKISLTNKVLHLFPSPHGYLESQKA